MRPTRLISLAVLAIVAAATVVFWSYIDAQRRAVIVLSTTSPKPVLSWAVRVVTAEPHSEDTSLAGVVTTIYYPGGGGSRHAVVLIPGVVPQGRLNPDVQRIARGLARAGLIAFVPDLPGMADGQIVPQTVRSAVDLAGEVLRRPDVKGGQVAFAGAWAGATVGLLAAEDPVLAPRISVVAGIAPWGAAPNLIRLATTGFALEQGSPSAYQASPTLGLTVGRSLVAALKPSASRQQLLELLGGVSPTEPDPLRVIRGLAVAGLDPDAAAVVSLLANRHPTVFDQLYASLPQYLKTDLEQLSPLVGAAQLRARVELATSSHDEISPPSESLALERASPQVHVTKTGSVAHGVPGGGFASNAWLVRALRAAVG